MAKAEQLTCAHTKHRLIIWFWVGWNPQRGQYETCWAPRPKSEDHGEG
jgi:hypothetical protein